MTESLYKTEEEIAEIIGIGVDLWRANALVLEPKGLPKRDPLFANRRYMPAVKAFLDRRYAPAASSEPERDWEENFHARSRRARPQAKAAG